MMHRLDAAINAIARRADALARQAVPDRGVAAGSEHERLMQRSEALFCVARAARLGWLPDRIAAAAKGAIAVTIERHNARRPSDPNWGVAQGAYDALIDEAVATLR